jgi:hypothetical protein
LKLRTIAMGVGLAGALALGYWLGVHREARRSAPTDNRSTAVTPTASAGSDSVLQPNPAAAKVVEEARAEHFTEFHTVQEVLALPSAFARREALYTIAGRADLRGLDALIAEAKNLSNPADRVAALEVLYLSYVERDPQRALRSALALPDSEARNDSLSRVGAAWARIAPQAAFQQAGLEADTAARTTLQNAIVRTWAALDPEEAFVSVAALSSSVQRTHLLQWTAGELVRQDPQRAAELFEKLKPSDSDRLQYALVSEWAHNDVRAAARWVTSQPRQRLTMLALSVAPVYAAQFPAEGLDWASRVDRSRSGGLWAQALTGLVDRDPDAALQLAFGTKAYRRRALAINSVVSAIAARDPALAIRHLEKLPAGEARSQIAIQIATQMAQTEPAAAVAWIAGLGDRNARTNGLHMIGEQLAQRNIELAVELTEQIPAESRARWVASIGNAYAQDSVDGALQWMRKYEALPGYSQVLPEFLWNLASQDADTAFEFAAGIADDGQRDNAIQTVVNAVAMQSPSDAAKWIDRIQDDGLQRSAVGQVTAGWVRFDSEAARKWVLSLDSSALRDSGLVQLVNVGSIEEIEPVLAQIQSPDLRVEAVFQAAFRLAGEDPQGARTLLRRHPLDPPHQQRFETVFKQRYGKSW